MIVIEVERESASVRFSELSGANRRPPVIPPSSASTAPPSALLLQPALPHLLHWANGQVLHLCINSGMCISSVPPWASREGAGARSYRIRGCQNYISALPQMLFVIALCQDRNNDAASLLSCRDLCARASFSDVCFATHPSVDVQSCEVSCVT